VLTVFTLYRCKMLCKVLVGWASYTFSQSMATSQAVLLFGSGVSCVHACGFSHMLLTSICCAPFVLWLCRTRT
jgi:hypothetical protein